MADLSADELLEALGVEVTPVKTSALSPFEERVIAGFEDIQRFFEEHKRKPFDLRAKMRLFTSWTVTSSGRRSAILVLICWAKSSLLSVHSFSTS